MRFLISSLFLSLPLLVLPVLTPCLIGPAIGQSQPKQQEWREAVQKALQLGEFDKAIDQLKEAIQTHSEDIQAQLLLGRILSHQRNYEEAVSAFSEAIRLNPRHLGAYQYRGDEQLKRGRFDDAITDFDKVIELDASRGPHHWQRGIALYYAKRYADGARQFESHQTVNSKDVENAVWHFLCVTRDQGLEKAKSTLIPIVGDPRTPMTEVHDLFAGTATVSDVLKAANASPTEVSPRPMTSAQFYAYLYLGLYFDALGEPLKALPYLEKAASQFERFNYMGEVARIHHLTLQGAANPKSKAL